MGDVALKEGAGTTAEWGDAEAVGQALFKMKNEVAVLEATGERERQRWLTAMQTVLADLQ